MITKEFIDNFYAKLPAYGVDCKAIVKVDESNITTFQEKFFDVVDSRGGAH